MRAAEALWKIDHRVDVAVPVRNEVLNSEDANARKQATEVLERINADRTKAGEK